MSSGERLYAGQTAATRDADRRARLLAAALQAFGTRGYFATAIEDLCAEAHIGTRSFYVFFATKEDLLLALYDELTDEVRAAVRGALERAPLEHAASARAGLMAFTGALLEDERKARVVIDGLIGVSPRCERRRREELRAFAAVIAQQRAKVGGPPMGEVELHVLMTALVGATIEVLVDWLRDRRGPLEPVVDQLVNLYVAPLTPRWAAAADATPQNRPS
jgi:AcrR family transcriptional regulator